MIIRDRTTTTTVLVSPECTSAEGGLRILRFSNFEKIAWTFFRSGVREGLRCSRSVCSGGRTLLYLSSD